MGLLAACDDNTPKEIAYTITVTSEDASVLSKIKVKVANADGSVTKQGALTNGKITFTLTEGDYTVTLVDVPDNYDYTSGQLSATKTECTIDLKMVYTVNVTYPEIKDVYGKTFSEEGPAANVTVKLYEGELERDLPGDLEKATLAATKTTNENGQAKFELTGEIYTIVLENYTEGLEVNQLSKDKIVNTIGKETPSVDLTFNVKTVLGSSKSSPLPFKIGENTIPLTNAALEKTGGFGVCYAFTPTETGNYTFTANGNAVVLNETSTPIINGGGSAVLALEANTTYYFYCIANSAPKKYTVTIAKGGELSGGDEPTYPWDDGTGTIDDPFVADTLVGEYTDLPASGTPLYVTYTPTKEEEYTVTQTAADLNLKVYRDSVTGSSQPLVQVDGSNVTADISLTAGTAYYFAISTKSNANGNVSFKIEVKPATPHQPTGTYEDPLIVTEFVGDYTQEIGEYANKYYRYFCDEDGKYTISTTFADAFIRVYSFDESLSEIGRLSPSSKSAEISLEAGKAYYINVATYSDDAGTVTFKIEQATESSTQNQIETASSDNAITSPKNNTDEVYLPCAATADGNYTVSLGYMTADTATMSGDTER